MPPTEKRGRVHTSTVTLSVCGDQKPKDSPYLLRDEKYFKIEAFKSSGPGGQHRNKVCSGIKCIHLPTGIKEERTSKSQHRNKKEARIAVELKLDRLYKGVYSLKEAQSRKEQRGSGQRGDKIRTYRLQDNRIVDHRSGKKTTWEKAKKGGLSVFWG